MRYFTLPVIQKHILTLRADLSILCTTCRGKKRINPVPEVLFQTDDENSWGISEVRHSRYNKNNPHKTPCDAAGYLIGYIRINWDRKFLKQIESKAAIAKAKL